MGQLTLFGPQRFLFAVQQSIVGEGVVFFRAISEGRKRLDNPGNNVKQKAGLNRAILDTAPGSFVNVLCVKAEEAG